MTGGAWQPPRDTEEGEVATSKRRRGKDAVDEDEILVDGGALDSVDDALADDSDDVDDEDEAPVGRGRRGATATKARIRVDGEELRTEERVGIFGRLLRFLREVVAELRKVIWPTRKELLTYASVVIVFVAVMLTIVASLDAAFAWGVLHVFGGAKK
jgi:preprotein translocase subunit SecE